LASMSRIFCRHLSACRFSDNPSIRPLSLRCLSARFRACIERRTDTRHWSSLPQKQRQEDRHLDRPQPDPRRRAAVAGSRSPSRIGPSLSLWASYAELGSLIGERGSSGHR
jgi:hypothetical protein